MIPRSLKCFLAAAAILAAAPAAAQERPQGCVLEAWPAFLDPWDQTHQLQEKIPTDAGEVLAIRFGPLSGEFAKLYMFMLVRDGCDRHILSVGSFGFQTEFARQRGEIGEGDRIYHLDLFGPDSHQVLEFLRDPPGYEAMRARALEVLR
ncbi:MAG TPA: hypothetical protein VLA52_15525 [Thermohalobaculum sp.]|nr:hypothetical protein [Thermohalobaculum sp.]